MDCMNKKKILVIVSLMFVGLISLAYFVIASQAEDKLFIKKGWNLIYGFTSSSLEGQNFEISHIKAIYAFIPLTQEYAMVYPKLENDKSDLMGDGYLSDTSLWVYSDIDAETEYWLQEPMPLTYIGEHKLYKGWNFFGITPAFIGKRLGGIKGDCTIEKAYIWDAGNQQWINLPLTEKMDESDEESKFGGGDNTMGLIIKVANDCRLGSVIIDEGGLPLLPEEENKIIGRECNTTEDCPTQFTEWSCKNETAINRYGEYYSCYHYNQKGICVSSPGGMEIKNCPGGCSNGVCV